MASFETESALVNVPSKVFYQGGFGAELPIIINYYNGSIEFDQQDHPKILLDEEQFERFVKSVRSGLLKAKQLRKH